MGLRRRRNASNKTMHKATTLFLAALLLAALAGAWKMMVGVQTAPTNNNVVTNHAETKLQPTNKYDCLLNLNDVRGIKYYSQNDEDGAILATLECMGGHGNKQYFEFGSENGMQVNTRYLREQHGWTGHLLDGGHENSTIPLHKEWFTPSNIVSLLEKYHVSKTTLDLLSIDCDYDDFYILREILLADYKPRILVVEYNPNFEWKWAVSTVAKPIGEEANVRWSGDCYFGASASALRMLANEFGYMLIWANGVNLIFVRLEQALAMGLRIPSSAESLTEEYTQPLHLDCPGKVWKVVDRDTVHAKATDANVLHADFASGLADVKLGTNNNYPVRTFYEMS
eukprot:CAMPEP_0183741162 /NCGR_PEP_ID=MMETSP0737-20130205/61421_1 /TAXON_ID=385413 /ORGANISM="Thalassiosira miniscula, Strain CCMP1093" /LENGTH=339 /DNA_ID=CAMNT_0025976415 /DNA_START=365 /DNA_END=1384 /DNA_ORIENTATION=+